MTHRLIIQLGPTKYSNQLSLFSYFSQKGHYLTMNNGILLFIMMHLSFPIHTIYATFEILARYSALDDPLNEPKATLAPDPPGNRFFQNSDIRHKLFPSNYDPNQAPSFEGNPCQVQIKIFIVNIRSIKEIDWSYTLDLFYHQYWTDGRLTFPDGWVNDSRIVLDHRWRQRLWIPDTYFKQAIAGRVADIIFPALYFSIGNNGDILMATRVTIQLLCSMKFDKYPHDAQSCDIDIMSLSNTREIVELKWKDFQITNSIQANQYKITTFTLNDCTKNYTIGVYSCIRVTLKLTRRIGHFVIKKYIPSFIIVIMSFVGFWIPTNSYPARVTLVITSLLALITQQLQTSAEINASYVVALNIWMIICISFVFLAFIEYTFAIIWSLSRVATNLAEAETSNGWKTERNFSITGSRQTRLSSKFISSPGNKIDSLSKKLFPCSYALCILLYTIYIVVD